MIKEVKPGTRIKIMDTVTSLLPDRVLHKTFTVIESPTEANDRCWFRYDGHLYWVLFSCLKIISNKVLTDIEYLDSLHSKRFEV